MAMKKVTREQFEISETPPWVDATHQNLDRAGRRLDTATSTALKRLARRR